MKQAAAADGEEAAAIAANAEAGRERLAPMDAYRLWAQVYDSQENPMLALEERHLERLFPELSQKTLVDVGCGSGRWLARLSRYSHERAKRLIGIDASREMLLCAAGKEFHAWLLLGSCNALPLRDGVADVALCSFMIGYCDDMAVFARELGRVVAHDGRLLISDLHPKTAQDNGWRRTFSVDGKSIEVEGRFWEIGRVRAALEAEGFQLSECLEPCFEERDLPVFAMAGKEAKFHALAGEPAIYILQFNRRTETPKLTLSLSQARSQLTTNVTVANDVIVFRGSRIATSASESSWEDLRIEEGRIVRGAGPAMQAMQVALDGYLLLPGLVNVHDHLEFALFPRLGGGWYRNADEWARDIYRPLESPVREHLRVPKHTRLWWGGLRNLLAGVTTVCHHNPFVAEVFGSEFPVDVVRDYAWAHSLTLEPDLRKRLEGREDGPFVIHLAEGVDEESAAELGRLETEIGVDSNTVIVHGVGLTKADRVLLQERGGALVWCPSSNVFLFGKTLTPEALREIGRVALGTDSPLTGAGDMLDELRFACEHTGMKACEAYDVMTSWAAEVLHLREGEGTLAPGAVANVVGVRDVGGMEVSPAETLVRVGFRDIGLVLRRGRVQLASDELMERLPQELTAGLEPLLIEDHFCWVRAPLDEMVRNAQCALGENLRLGGKEIRYAGAKCL
ncbi:MAG: methyltransferase domain-containing protein [Candidatus Korobacteraceae bacterium]